LSRKNLSKTTCSPVTGLTIFQPTINFWRIFVWEIIRCLPTMIFKGSFLKPRPWTKVCGRIERQYFCILLERFLHCYPLNLARDSITFAHKNKQQQKPEFLAARTKNYSIKITFPHINKTRNSPYMNLVQVCSYTTNLKFLCSKYFAAKSNVLPLLPYLGWCMARNRGWFLIGSRVSHKPDGRIQVGF